MEVNVENQGACLIKISFTVTSAEFENEVRRGLDEVRSTTRMKGFRPGKTPLAVVQKAYAQGIREDVKQHFLRLAFQRAIQEQSLKPLGNPRVTVDDLKGVELPENADFAFEFEMELRPEFELGDYAELEVASELAPVMPEEVQNAIAEFKRRQARPEEAGADGFPEGGMAIAKVELVHEDDVVLEREGLRLSAETPLPGTEPEVWQAAVRGQKVDIPFEVPLQIPDVAEIEKEAARGQAGTARVTFTQVYKLVEPTDEELHKLVEVDGQEAFEAKVRANLESANQEQENARIEALLLDRVIDMHDFELPERMVADQLQGRLKELRAGLEAQGIEGEALETQVQAGEAEARTGSARSVRAFFVLEAIAQKEGLQVTDEEMRAELAKIARRNEASFEEVVNFYREHNQMNQLALEIAEGKVRRTLREKARITQPQ